MPFGFPPFGLGGPPPFSPFAMVPRVGVPILYPVAKPNDRVEKAILINVAFCTVLDSMVNPLLRQVIASTRTIPTPSPSSDTQQVNL